MRASIQKVDAVLLPNAGVRFYPVLKVLLPVIYGAVLLVVFFLSYSMVFDKKIDLNGDDTGYYLLGKALAAGKGYTNIADAGTPAHNHFPPGYPAIIAVFCKLFSNDLVFIKKVNGFFLLASIVLLCCISWKIRRNVHITFLVALFSVLNSHLLEYSFNTMSEVPFMFFCLLCILLAMYTSFEKPVSRNVSFGVLIICISLTYHMRTTGITLFIGLLAFLLLRKNWSYALTAFVGFVLLALPWYLRGRELGGNSYLFQLMLKNPYKPELDRMQLADWFSRFGHNLVRYWAKELPSLLQGVSIDDYDLPVSPVEAVKGSIMILLMLYGWYRIRRRNVILLSFFILSYCGILFLWPSVWVGVRFLLPLLPLLLLLLINGLFETFRLLLIKVKLRYPKPVAVVAVMMVAALLIKPYVRPMDELKKEAKSDFPTAYKNFFELAVWSKRFTPDTAVICNRKGGLFYLYSHRVGVPFLQTLNTEEELAYLKKAGVDYIVVEELGYADSERYLGPVIKKYPEKFRAIKPLADTNTYLLQLLH